MLWKKESICSGALLVDILEEYYNDGMLDMFRTVEEKIERKKNVLKKSNKLSNHYRKKGLEQFNASNWLEAIEFFNQALCFAEKNTQDMGSLYANRSACFFHLELYDKCIVDIKLAKENQCPKIHLPKLNKWEVFCRKMLLIPANKQGESTGFQAKLSFDSNERYPGMANILQIDRKISSERRVITKHNIGVGETILIENGFVWTTNETYRRCSVCLQTTSNLVPCDDCTSNLVCYGSCEKSELHKIECQMNLNTNDNNDIDLRMVVRSILTAMQIIPNVSELERFAQHVVGGDENGNRMGYNSVSTSLSKYAAFLENGLKWQWTKKQCKYF